MSPASEFAVGRALRHVPNVITVVRGLLIPVIGALLLQNSFAVSFSMFCSSFKIIDMV